MTITRYPLLIICLFTVFLLAGCAALDDMGREWKNSKPQVATQAPTDTTIKQSSRPANNNFDSLPPVKVAILLPLSGPQGAIGQSMLQSAQLALFDIGYTNFNLIPRDTQGTAAGASVAATAAINEGAQLILGPLFADSVRAVKAIAKPRNINVIAFSTDWALADRSTFMMGFMPFSQVERITQYATMRGYKQYALIAPRDTYGDVVAGRFEQSARKNNANIVKSIRYAHGDQAVMNEIASLQSGAEFQAVFMPVGGAEVDKLSTALSQNKMLPSQVKRLGTGLWDDPRLAAQPNMQGAWFAAPSPASRRAFEQQYSNTYGQKPARLGTLAYDATALAAILARNGFQNSGKPAFDYTSLTDPNGFAGTDGVFRFQPNGVVDRALAVLEIRSNQIVEIDPAPKRF